MAEWSNAWDDRPSSSQLDFEALDSSGFGDPWSKPQTTAKEDDAWVIPDVLPPPRTADVLEDYGDWGASQERGSFQVPSEDDEQSEQHADNVDWAPPDDRLDAPVVDVYDDIQTVATTSIDGEEDEAREDTEDNVFERALDALPVTGTTDGEGVSRNEPDEWGQMSLPELKTDRMPTWDLKDPSPGSTFDLPTIASALPEWSPPVRRDLLNAGEYTFDGDVIAEGQDGEVTASDIATPSADPWIAVPARNSDETTMLKIKQTPEQITSIVAEARKLTAAACTASPDEMFAPPRGMGLNLDSLLEADGELSSLGVHQNNRIASRVPFKQMRTYNAYVNGIAKSGARSAEILKGNTAKRQPLRTQALKSGFLQNSASPGVPNVGTAGTTAADPLAIASGSTSVPAPGMLAGLFGRRSQTPVTAPPSRSASPAASSIDDIFYAQQQARPSVDSLRSSANASANSAVAAGTTPPASPGNTGNSKVRSFFNRFSRAAVPASSHAEASAKHADTANSVNDEWLEAQDVKVLESGGVKLNASLVDEELGTYAEGGLLANESPAKIRHANGPTNDQPALSKDFDDLFSNFRAQPSPSARAATRAKPSEFDMFDPLVTSNQLLPKQTMQQPVPTPSSFPFLAGSSNGRAGPLPKQAHMSSTAPVTKHPPVKLAPPPPSNAPVQSGQDLFSKEDDDFGDFSSFTSVPAAEGPVFSSAPLQPVTYGYHPPSRPSQQPDHKETGLSKNDLSFFDNL